MDKLSGIGGIQGVGRKNPPVRTAPPTSMEKKDPGEMVLEYVCSKGDREYHSINDSFTSVKAHEQGHIDEYNEMAQKLGLKVVNPHISVFSEFFPEINRSVAIGGRASCQFTAIIDGHEVLIPVSKDGHITDSEVVKKLENEKKRRMGLLPAKDGKKEEKAEGEKTLDKSTSKNKEIKQAEEKSKEEKPKDKDPEDFLVFGE